MDLGIAGKWALVCGASKGLGLGCAQALAAEGVNVVVVARGGETLEQSATALRALPGARSVLAVAADITTVAGRAAARFWPVRTRESTSRMVVPTLSITRSIVPASDSPHFLEAHSRAARMGVER